MAVLLLRGKFLHGGADTGPARCVARRAELDKDPFTFRTHLDTRQEVAVLFDLGDMGLVEDFPDTGGEADSLVEIHAVEIRIQIKAGKLGIQPDTGIEDTGLDGIGRHLEMKMAAIQPSLDISLRKSEIPELRLAHTGIQGQVQVSLSMLDIKRILKRKQDQKAFHISPGIGRNHI